MQLLKDLTPPRGTTKTVELTRSERKTIGRRKLAQIVASQFLGLGNRVTIKQNGSYYTFVPAPNGVNVSYCTWSGSRLVSPRFFDATAFMDFLVTRLDPCSMVRMLKLVEKNVLDAHSQKVQKDKQTRKSFKPNFVLIFEL